MSGILGAIRSHNGIVIVSGVEEDGTACIEINNNSVAVVFRGKTAVKDFLEKYIIPKKPNAVLDAVTLIDSELKLHFDEYKEHDFSFFVAGIENGRSGYFSFWSENGQLNTIEVKQTSHFINTIEDLAVYIITKVFSEQMTVEELKNLMIFVSLQCIKVFGYDSFFNITIINNEGIKKMSEGEIKDSLSIQDKKDHKLKKIFSDFFIKEDMSK
jgi:hypothetical protein